MLGFLNPLLYELRNGGSNADVFNDMTSGDNPGCRTSGFKVCCSISVHALRILSEDICWPGFRRMGSKWGCIPRSSSGEKSFTSFTNIQVLVISIISVKWPLVAGCWKVELPLCHMLITSQGQPTWRGSRIFLGDAPILSTLIGTLMILLPKMCHDCELVEWHCLSGNMKNSFLYVCKEKACQLL